MFCDSDFHIFPQSRVVRVEDLRERSAEVWAQCRALATELGEAEAALARRQAEECLGAPETTDEVFVFGREEEVEFQYSIAFKCNCITL